MDFVVLAFVLVLGVGWCVYSKQAMAPYQFRRLESLPHVRNRLIGTYVYVGIPQYQFEIKRFTVTTKETDHSDIIAQRYLYGKPYEGEITLQYWDEGVYRWKYPTNNMFTYFTIKGYNPVVIEQTSEHNPTYVLLKVD